MSIRVRSLNQISYNLNIKLICPKAQEVNVCFSINTTNYQTPISWPINLSDDADPIKKFLTCALEAHRAKALYTVMQ